MARVLIFIFTLQMRYLRSLGVIPLTLPGDHGQAGQSVLCPARLEPELVAEYVRVKQDASHRQSDSSVVTSRALVSQIMTVVMVT